jgi:uncharacterized Zn-finger protein
MLKYHYARHTDERPFPCNSCEKSFKLNCDLVQHKLQHSEKQFACDQCQSTFHKKIQLKQHYLIHLELKPHNCLDCSESFRLRKSLKIHIRKHHPEKVQDLTMGNLAMTREEDITFNLNSDCNADDTPPIGAYVLQL